MSLLGMILKKKDDMKDKQFIEEEPGDMEYHDFLYLRGADCFPINLAKGYVGTDGKFKISFLLKNAREDGKELFCGFTDETGYDLEKMSVIADFYEGLLRKSEYSLLNKQFREASYALKTLDYNRFSLMEALDCKSCDKEHRLYIVTMVERFCELVRYAEMWSEGKKTDYYDIIDDSGFLYLIFKYDLPDVFTQDAFDQFFESEKDQDEELYTITDADDDDLFDWDDDEDDDEDEDEDEEEEEEEEEEWEPPYFDEMGKAFESAAEETAESDSPEEQEKVEA